MGKLFGPEFLRALVHLHEDDEPLRMVILELPQEGDVKGQVLEGPEMGKNKFFPHSKILRFIPRFEQHKL